MRLVGLALLLAATTVVVAAPVPDFAGDYVTNHDLLRLEQSGEVVTGTYGKTGAYRIDGRIVDGVLEFRWTAGRDGGTGRLELEDDGHRLTGTSVRTDGRDAGTWSGWRKDADAESGRTVRFAGCWRSSLGLLDLWQKGAEVTGTYGCQGWGEIAGEVKGRRLHLEWTWPRGTGNAWLEMTPDGSTLFGIGRSSGDGVPFRWIGQRLTDHYRGARPRPGTLVEGIAGNGMTYVVRPPKGWRSSRRTPAIVILHGEDSASRSYVETIATRWPTVAERYVLIGIDGERWNDSSPADDPRHEYTFANWMGRSTYEGYPLSHRESPALVAEVVDELAKRLRLDRVFVGGHSQGGSLAFLLAMHSPETFAGAFPMSCDLVIQAEPGAFAGDERRDLRLAQRARPLAIVHGEDDEVVPFSGALYAHERFVGHGWPLLALFSQPTAGHEFARLPVPEVVRWLDALSTTDEEALTAFAEQSLATRRWRDVAAAIRRADDLRMRGRSARVFKRAGTALDEAAGPGAKELASLLAANADSSWAERFERWRLEFEFAPVAAPTMAAYEKLRREHEEPANKLMAEARQAFAAGDEKTGWAKRQEIVDRYPASSVRATVARWIRER